MIFPLPLSPLEYYFWCDDTPDYPTTFPIELTFSGKVDPDAFEQALTATVGRHPLLSATIDAGGVWPHWVETSPRIHFDWNDSDTPVTHPQGEHLDLTSSPGMRTWIREGSEQTKVYFQFHHTCVDGLAVQQFVEDMLVQYCLNIGAGNDRTRLRGLDQRQLLRRHACCRSLREGLKQPLQRLRDAVDMVWEWHKIMNRRPAVLAECRDSDSFLDRQANVDGASGCLRQSKPTHRLLDFSTHTLDGDQVRRLKRIATDNHVSANDLLVSDMFRAMRNWNVRHRPQDDQANPWLSISIPANERQLADRSMPAANRLGMAFLSRRVNQCAAGSALLSSVHKEMETIRRRHRGRC
ncbi:MAG: hypothetical protein KDA60_05400, partial [Planctomycetales bacterium]|nr:hypothetical protein [Planctomycetales bacterium]